MSTLIELLFDQEKVLIYVILITTTACKPHKLLSFTISQSRRIEI